MGSNAQEVRRTGAVTAYNTRGGWGYIQPENGGQMIYLHQEHFRANGLKFLSKGERVEFTLEVQGDGRLRAVDVTGPGGAYLQCFPSPCSKCGRYGHVAKVCRLGRLERLHCGELGHISKHCRQAEGENTASAPPFPRWASRSSTAPPSSRSSSVGNAHVRFKTVICFKCQGVGHISKYCRSQSQSIKKATTQPSPIWLPKSSADPPSPGSSCNFITRREEENYKRLVCFQCLELGHISKFCPSQVEGRNRAATQQLRGKGNVSPPSPGSSSFGHGRNRVDFRKVSCTGCRELGHSSKFCPMASQGEGHNRATTQPWPALPAEL